MRTDSPTAVTAQIGSIEDGLAVAQNPHADAKGLVFELDEKLKTLRQNLVKELPAELTNETQRKAWVEEQVRNTTLYAEWVVTKQQLVKHEIRLEYLSKRLSACQSVLKRMEHEHSGRFGHGAGQFHSEPPDE